MHFDTLGMTSKDLWKGRNAFAQMAGEWPKISKSYVDWDGKDRHHYFWSFYQDFGMRLGARSVYSREKIQALFAENTHSIEHLIPRSFMEDQLKSRGVSQEYFDSAISNPFNLAPSNRKVNRRRGSYPFDTEEDEVFVRDQQRFKHVHWTYGLDYEREWVIPPRSRGDVARAVMYMCLIYQFKGEYAEDFDVLLSWHREDPPSEIEYAYNDWVKQEWGVQNPFLSR